MTITIRDRDFLRELVFSASRSAGAGGQNVNKVNTKMELRFNINASTLLSDEEKATLLTKLSNRINLDGELLIVSQTERTQLRNKIKCIDKFYELLEAALRVQKKRKATKPTSLSKLKRLELKKQHSEIKKLRNRPIE